MKRYFKLLFAFCICSLMIGACKDSDNETGGDSTNIVASFGTPLMKTMENITPLQIPVVLSKPASRDVKVLVAISKENGAVEGVDYKFHSKEVTIAKGASIGYFEVDLTDDRGINPDRIFDIELLEATGVKVSEQNGLCQVVIRSDEGLPVLELSKNVVSIGEDEGQLSIPVILSRTYNQDVLLKVYATDSTARQGENFTILNSELRIAAGDTSANINIRIINDNVINADRIFMLKIADARNAVISEVYAQCRVTIVNDEKVSYVSFKEVKGEVFESGGSLLIPVKIEGNPKTPVKVNFKITGGTAVEGTDFEFENKELTFPVGIKEKMVKVLIKDNAITNKDRTLKIGFAELDGVMKATKDTVYNMTILNDDFDYKKLYDDMMGTWTLTQTSTDKSPLVSTLIISGGRSLEEEDANYLNKFVCRVSGFVWSTDLVFTMNYNVENGEITVNCLEPVMRYDFGGTFGDCNVKFENDEATKTLATTTNKNFTKITWKPVSIKGMLYKFSDDSRFNTRHFTLENVVLTKNK